MVRNYFKVCMFADRGRILNDKLEKQIFLKNMHNYDSSKLYAL